MANKASLKTLQFPPACLKVDLLCPTHPPKGVCVLGATVVISEAYPGRGGGGCEECGRRGRESENIRGRAKEVLRATTKAWRCAIPEVVLAHFDLIPKCARTTSL